MFVTIHGHFYQPPRESPWTAEIPRQESAAPYHDWNERITAECYEPNACSRVLDQEGRIAALVNNYVHVSFDFGPTLLSDLERRSPPVYRRVIEGDRESRAHHGGHGNAIAQAYSHMILPLANYRDKWTQVRWGLRDFEARFGRPSEGLWLPETAIDAETLQIVAEAGVRFLVLAPRQALRWRRIGDPDWRRVSPEEPIDPSTAYRCFVNGVNDRPRRALDVFFYDDQLAVGVSFEHLLHTAEGFAARLEESGRVAGVRGLVHLATDGEVYGHHEPFGDMCLAYLIDREGPARGFRLVNYPEYLDLCPPSHEVELDFGETGEGTAWSCAHGVGRWIRDCGCVTGGQAGWNQKWRSPLRRGLDAIRDQIQATFLARTSPFLKDAWAARDDYITVLLKTDPGAREDYLAKHLRGPVDRPTRIMIWSLLEATHQAMLMYTSCAWFFSDISGIEVQQNLGYAARACELAQPYVGDPLEALLLRHLAQAKSNDPVWKDGAHLYRSLVRPRRVGPEHAAAQAVLEASVLGRPLTGRIHRYPIQGSLDPDQDEGRHGWSGRVRVADEMIDQEWSWSFSVEPRPLGEREVDLRPAVDPEASPGPTSSAIRLIDLQRDDREAIAQAALGRVLRRESDRIEEIYEEARPSMGLLSELGLPVPEIHRTLGASALEARFRALAEEVSPEPATIAEEWWTRLDLLLEERRRLGLGADARPVAAVIAERLHTLLDLALSTPDRSESLDAIAMAYETVASADRRGLPLARSGMELRTYELVLRYRSDLVPQVFQPGVAQTPGEHPVSPGIRALRELAGHANLSLREILRPREGFSGTRVSLASTGGKNRDA